MFHVEKQIRLKTLLATAEHIHQAKFALDVKKAVLPLYEKVFDVGYPLPKLDTLVVSILP
jgi:aminopeptidase 2